MFRPAIAVFAATSAGVLLAAAPVSAEDGDVVPCSNNDYISINVSPPPPLTGNVDADDIRRFFGAIAGGSPWTPRSTTPSAFPRPVLPFMPSPTPSATPGSFVPRDAGPPPAVPDAPLWAVPNATPSSPPLSLAHARSLIDVLVSRAKACAATATPAPGSATSPVPLTDSEVAQLLETLAATRPVCTTSSTPAPTPRSFLDAIGVSALLDPFITGCAPVAPAPPPAAAAPSLLDSLGISGLLGGLLCG
ncbi:hypothetical protein ACFLIM_11385 [Nonomuraea sp. M3C6]|uniref:Secreted protein n=1 Tax=Nonomuraea marmarensis TaxID=3351344 RepID=A0ABW7A8X4_9ACTN